MGVVKKIIETQLKNPEIVEYDRFLFVGPHPDDVEVGCGATIAKLAKMGKKITIVICTDGRYGDEFTNYKGDELVSKREAEAIASAKDLGVSDVRFLGLSDGAFYEIDELKEGLRKVVSDVNPEIIFVSDPDITSECHPDHINAGRCIKEISFFAPFENVMKKKGCKKADVKAIAFYFTAKPNKYVNTTGYFKVQMDTVLNNYKTQFPKGSSPEQYLSAYLKLRARFYGIRNFCQTAEAFKVLNQTMMHAMPEFSD